MLLLQRGPVAGMPSQHSLHHGFQGVGVFRNDVPQNSIVHAKVLVTDAVADAFDLAPRLAWEVCEPGIGNAPYRLRYCLDRVGRRTTNYRIIAEGMQRRARLDPVPDRDLGEAVANGNRQVPGHYETRIASRSMLSLISG